MKFKKYFFSSFILCYTFLAIAQEVRVPLVSNPNLFLHSKTKESPNHFKASAAFPIVDYFEKEGNINNPIWDNYGVSVVNRNAIFNALDSNGNAYPSGQACDALGNLLPINISTTKQRVFLSFIFNTGNTFNSGDSLILLARDKFGVFQKIWESPNVPAQNQEIIIELADHFISSQFAFYFSSYAAQHSASNNEIFTIAKFVLAEKWQLGIHEHLRFPNLPDSTISSVYFSGPDVKTMDGLDIQYPWGNCAKLDVLNAAGLVYNQASNAYGGADTFYTHPFDVLQNPISDSIFYSFTLKASVFNVLGDSLLVEFKNNLGNWVRVLALSGVGSNQYKTYNFNINAGRFRHANFQSRFVFKTTFSQGNLAHWLLSGFKIIKKVPLPFFDDFSNARVTVSQDKWIDNFVFVNNDFPINQPSLNVATFDGLDANGNAYSKFALKGICDQLTTRSIDLSGMGPADSLILSFYFQYEPQGTTNQVYPDDSLEIEFRSTAMDKDSFLMVHMISARDTFLNRFTYYQYTLINPVFFHNDFQIRFKNRGSQSGNLSQWHLDYVRFNKGRKSNDAIKDIALSNTPPVLLGPYTSMPWNQYQANKGNYTNLSDQLRLVNHDDQAYAVDYFRSVMKPEGDTLDKFNNILPTIRTRSDSTVSIAKSVVFTSTQQADSLVFTTKYKIKISGNQNDNVTGNDTFSVPTIFSNYMAYDDGTAEGGYGVANKLNVGACLRYQVEVPDSLYGLYVFFNQSEKDVSTQRFNLKVWKKISPLFEQATADEVMYNQEIARPIYTNQLNGFTAFKFAQALAVTDTFYIGWEQTAAYVLNIGLDKNYRFGINPNMAYKMDGRWYPTEIQGALMMRPILGKFLGVPTGMAEPKFADQLQFNLYPNPTSGVVNVDLVNSENYEISLYDLVGKLHGKLYSNQGEIKLPTVDSGIYLMVFENKEGTQKTTKKIIIQ